jgi:hypothetical protein
VDVVRFIDNNVHNMLLEILIPEINRKPGKMSLARLKELLNRDDEESSTSESTSLLIPYVLL